MQCDASDIGASLNTSEKEVVRLVTLTYRSECLTVLTTRELVETLATDEHTLLVMIIHKGEELISNDRKKMSCKIFDIADI